MYILVFVTKLVWLVKIPYSGTYGTYVFANQVDYIKKYMWLSTDWYGTITCSIFNWTVYNERQMILSIRLSKCSVLESCLSGYLLWYRVCYWNEWFWVRPPDVPLLTKLRKKSIRMVYLTLSLIELK